MQLFFNFFLLQYFYNGAAIFAQDGIAPYAAESGVYLVDFVAFGEAAKRQCPHRFACFQLLVGGYNGAFAAVEDVDFAVKTECKNLAVVDAYDFKKFVVVLDIEYDILSGLPFLALENGERAGLKLLIHVFLGGRRNYRRGQYAADLRATRRTQL